MLKASRERLLEQLEPDDVVLDVGGWGDPFERANWIMDLFPYETRGLYERRGWVEERSETERFSKETWVQRDICDREPFPFADDELDFVICSHTLEDIRDPIWVCSEIQRIGKAGYVEVPSRLEEQSWGVTGEFVGWAHHHWLIDVSEDAIEFVFKPHVIHSVPSYYFPNRFWRQLSEREKVQSLWWQGSFSATERVIFDESSETLEYLSDFVEREMIARGFEPGSAATAPLGVKLRARAAGALRRAR